MRVDNERERPRINLFEIREWRHSLNEEIQIWRSYEKWRGWKNSNQRACDRRDTSSTQQDVKVNESGPLVNLSPQQFFSFVSVVSIARSTTSVVSTVVPTRR